MIDKTSQTSSVQLQRRHQKKSQQSPVKTAATSSQSDPYTSSLDRVCNTLILDPELSKHENLQKVVFKTLTELFGEKASTSVQFKQISDKIVNALKGDAAASDLLSKAFQDSKTE